MSERLDRRLERIREKQLAYLLERDALGTQRRQRRDQAHLEQDGLPSAAERLIQAVRKGEVEPALKEGQEHYALEDSLRDRRAMPCRLKLPPSVSRDDSLSSAGAEKLPNGFHSLVPVRTYDAPVCWPV